MGESKGPLLSRLVIFAFCFLGMFAVMFVAMPSGLMENQQTWDPTYFRTDQQVAQFFNAHNITLYDSQASANLTFNDHLEYQAGLPSGWKLEIWWDDQYRGLPIEWSLGLGLLSQHWFLGTFEYWTYEDLHYSTKSGIDRGEQIIKSELVTDFTTDLNGTFYSARCNSGIQVTILYTTNETDIGTGFDAGHLSFLLSYELNATMSAVNMFTLLGQILTFQAPNLGVPGIFGTILNAMIAIPIYATSGFIVYKLIAGIAPWLSGGSGD